ncbi:hypothetical protein GCM10022278_38430 [Allohahella marinimesophila]|uniref:NodB homology domain-containing protein n=1 Tax=Allohahella marinimesophila TaxID=1054972 RepID=A0ABP7Q822_9GAMM
MVSLSDLVENVTSGNSVAGKLVITFDDGYRDNFQYAAPILKSQNLPATFFITSGFIGNNNTAWWDQGAKPAPSWMEWEEVLLLRKAGFSIGSHTMHHANLGTTTALEAWREIVDSKKTLEHQLNMPVDLFAYPYGGKTNFNEEARELVKRAGYSCCLSCHGGIVAPNSDPFSLNRVAISEWQNRPEQLIMDVVREAATLSSKQQSR